MTVKPLDNLTSESLSGLGLHSFSLNYEDRALALALTGSVFHDDVVRFNALAGRDLMLHREAVKSLVKSLVQASDEAVENLLQEHCGALLSLINTRFASKVLLFLDQVIKQAIKSVSFVLGGSNELE